MYIGLRDGSYRKVLCSQASLVKPLAGDSPQNKLFSPAGDTLIKIGKTAKEKLVPLLTGTSKGIISHFLLSYIWADTTNNKPQLTSSVYPIDNNQDAFLGVRFADFDFYRNIYNRNFAKQADLDKNKKRWIVF